MRQGDTPVMRWIGLVCHGRRLARRQLLTQPLAGGLGTSWIPRNRHDLLQATLQLLHTCLVACLLELGLGQRQELVVLPATTPGLPPA